MGLVDLGTWAQMCRAAGYVPRFFPGADPIKEFIYPQETNYEKLKNAWDEYIVCIVYDECKLILFHFFLCNNHTKK